MYMFDALGCVDTDVQSSAQTLPLCSLSICLASHDLSLFALCIQGNHNYCALKTHSHLQCKLYIKVSVSPEPCGPQDIAQMNFSLSSIKLNSPL